LIVGCDPAIVESSLWQRILRTVNGAPATGIEATPGRHREQSEKGQRSDDPRKRICSRLTRDRYSGSDHGAAAVTELGAGT
jgi:hypothetical protein